MVKATKSYSENQGSNLIGKMPYGQWCMLNIYVHYISAKLGDEEITKVSKKANRTKDSAARLKRKYMSNMNAHNQDKKDIDEYLISLTKKARLQLLVKFCSEGRHGQQDCWS